MFVLSLAPQVIIALKYLDVETFAEVNGMWIFTNKLCTVKPNTNEIHISTLTTGQPNLDALSPDFLHKCKSIKTVSITVCRIKSLHQDLFKFSENLEVAAFYCNQISFIPENLFKPLKKLKHLLLNANPIKTLEPIMNSNLINLKWLDVENCGIPAEQFDIKLLKKYFPSLNRIGFHHNYMTCDVSEQLLQNFSESQIVVEVENDGDTSSCNTRGAIKCISSSLFGYISTQVIKRDKLQGIAAVEEVHKIDKKVNEIIFLTNRTLEITKGAIKGESIIDSKIGMAQILLILNLTIIVIALSILVFLMYKKIRKIHQQTRDCEPNYYLSRNYSIPTGDQ